MTGTRRASSVVTTVAELRARTDAVRAAGGTVGFFGTSGNLHAGHLSIIERMGRECDLAVMPLFLSPVAGLIDLGDGSEYHRDFDADAELAFGAGLDLAFRPTREEMYPRVPVQVRVALADALAEPWDNAEDPGFIRMSATGILKYWNLAGPCRYYAGQKDWVVIVVMRRMIEDLSLPIDLVECPVERATDGVCASSRNRKLTPAERAAAPQLYRALQEAAAAIAAGERRPAAVRDRLRARVAEVAPVDYAEVVEASTLRRMDALEGELRLLVSASFSRTHLFDNLGATVGG